MLGHVALFGRSSTARGLHCTGAAATRPMPAAACWPDSPRAGCTDGWSTTVERDPLDRRAPVSVAGQLKAGQLLPGGRERGRLFAVLFIGLPTLGRSGLSRSCPGTKAALERLAPFLNHCFLRLRPCLSGLAAAPVAALGAPEPVAFASGLRALALISRQVSHPT